MTVPLPRRGAAPVSGWLCIVAVAGIGLLFRVACLGEWSLYGDEWFTFAHSAEIGHLPFSELRSSIRAYPLIYLLTRLAVDTLGEREWVMRLFPCIMGIAAVPLFYILTRRWAGRWAAGMGSLFLALSPWMIFYSQLARFYTGAFLFAMTAVFLLYGGLREPCRAKMWGGALALTAATLFHPSSAVVLPAFLLFVVSVRFVDRSFPLPSLGYFLPLLVLAGLGAVVAVFNFQAVEETLFRNISLSHSWSYSTSHLLFGLVYNFGFHLALLALLGFLSLWRRDRSLAFYLLILISTTLIPLVCLACLGKSVGQRYTIPVSSALFLLAGWGGAALVRPLFSCNKTAFAAVLAALLVLNVPSLYSYFRDGDRLDYRGAAQYVGARAKRGDLVFSQSHAIFSYYLREGGEGAFADRVETVPVLETSPEYRGARLEELVGRCETVWVVLEKARLEAGGFFSEDLTRYVRERCSLVTSLYEPRLDYHQNVLRIYRSDPRSE